MVSVLTLEDAVLSFSIIKGQLIKSELLALNDAVLSFSLLSNSITKGQLIK